MEGLDKTTDTVTADAEVDKPGVEDSNRSTGVLGPVKSPFAYFACRQKCCINTVYFFTCLDYAVHSLFFFNSLP